MNRWLLPCFRFLLPLLTFIPGSLVLHAPSLTSFPFWLSTQPDFHVQLFYLCLTSDWESFLSHIRFALNPKSNSSALLRTA